MYYRSRLMRIVGQNIRHKYNQCAWLQMSSGYTGLESGRQDDLPDGNLLSPLELIA